MNKHRMKKHSYTMSLEAVFIALSGFIYASLPIDLFLFKMTMLNATMLFFLCQIALFLGLMIVGSFSSIFRNPSAPKRHPIKGLL